MSAHLIDERLAALLDGALSPAERVAADAHLEVCAQCREELALAAGARDALRALPRELRPPVDIAAAVAREIGAGPASARASGGPPRWYRTAGVVAVAAAIALAAVIVPNLGGRSAQDRAGTSAAEASALTPKATGVAGQETGSADGGDAEAATGGALPVERRDRDFDAASLHALVKDTARSTLAFVSAAPSSGLVSGAEDGAGVVACARSAGGTAIIPSEAEPIRVIAATYEGFPARIVVFAVGRGEDVQLRVVAAAVDGCRLLAADAASPPEE